MTIENSQSLPSKGGKVDPNQFKEVKEYLNSLEDEMTIRKLERLALQFGYNASQINELHDFCLDNHIDIPSSKLEMIRLWYSYLEEMKFLNNETLNLKASIEEFRKIQLSGYKKELQEEQSKTIAAFIKASEDVKLAFAHQAADFEDLLNKMDPSGELASRFTDSILQGISQDVHKVIDECASSLDQVLSNHSDSLQEVGNGVQTRIDLLAQQLNDIEAVGSNPKTIVDPIVNAIAIESAKQLAPVQKRIESLTDTASTALIDARNAFGNMSSAAQQSVRDLSHSSVEAVDHLADHTSKRMRQVSESCLKVTNEKTKMEWVKHAAWITGGTLLVSFTGMFIGLMVFFKWTYPWLIRA